MQHQSHRTRYVFLMLGAFLAVGAVIAFIVVVRFQMIRSSAELEAALLTSSVLTPTLERAAGDLSSKEVAAFTREASGLLGGQLWTIRLWNLEGELLTATDGNTAIAPDLQALEQASQGNISAIKARVPSGDALVSYTPLANGAVLDVAQDYSPIANSIANSLRSLLIVAIAGGVALILVLPVILWQTSRGITRRYDRLLYLHQIAQTTRSTLELGDVLEQMARNAAITIGAQMGLATLVHEETEDLILKGSFDAQADTSSQHHKKVEEWFLRRCAATGETIAGREKHFPFPSLLMSAIDPEAAVSVLSVPIPGHERVIGVVTVLRNGGRKGFTAAEVQIVEDMARQSAMGVEQAMLFAKVRSYASEVEMSYDTTLKVLMAALDTKDAVTQGHSERVSRLTVTVAKEMGIPKERLVDIERGALLHDVGKIGVPDEILKKPADLNEGEWEAMRKHPLLAGLMVSNVGFLEGAMPILLYHHERYDGKGYPFGLEGAMIPLEARIFAVIDTYDAITSDRPYRKAATPEEALEEIQRNINTQFDPKVVEAFTRVFRRMQPALDEAA